MSAPVRAAAGRPGGGSGTRLGVSNPGSARFSSSLAAVVAGGRSGNVEGASAAGAAGEDQRPEGCSPALPRRRGTTATALALFPAPPIETPRAPAYDRATMHSHEVETLGFLISAHPLEPYVAPMRDRGTIPARDLDKHAGHRVTVLGWHVTSKLAETKHGEPMEFVTFEDTTGLVDATFFPRAYERFCHLLTSTRPFILSGRVEEEYGVCTLNIEKVERL